MVLVKALGVAREGLLTFCVGLHSTLILLTRKSSLVMF
jgi:hypothetical protein